VTFGRAGAWIENLLGSTDGEALDLIHGPSKGAGALAMGRGRAIVSEKSAEHAKVDMKFLPSMFLLEVGRWKK